MLFSYCWDGNTFCKNIFGTPLLLLLPVLSTCFSLCLKAPHKKKNFSGSILFLNSSAKDANRIVAKELATKARQDQVLEMKRNLTCNLVILIF